MHPYIIPEGSMQANVESMHFEFEFVHPVSRQTSSIGGRPLCALESNSGTKFPVLDEGIISRHHCNGAKYNPEELSVTATILSNDEESDFEPKAFPANGMLKLVGRLREEQGALKSINFSHHKETQNTVKQHNGITDFTLQDSQQNVSEPACSIQFLQSLRNLRHSILKSEKSQLSLQDLNKNAHSLNRSHCKVYRKSAGSRKKVRNSLSRLLEK